MTTPRRGNPRLLVLAGMALVLGACAGDRIYVTSSQEGAARFDDYLDYRWLARDERRIPAWMRRYPALAKMVEAAVDLELSYKGFRRKEAGKVDFLVSVDTNVEDVAVISSGRYRGWAHGYNYFRVMSYRNVSNIDRAPQGMLTIRIVDAVSDRVVWQGTGAGVARASQGLDRRLREVVEQTLATFPPMNSQDAEKKG